MLLFNWLPNKGASLHLTHISSSYIKFTFRNTTHTILRRTCQFSINNRNGFGELSVMTNHNVFCFFLNDQKQ
ncbi:hypothetical protein XENTR_v10005989 [Xenopus tropicalis]|nr:hypothetical protein XENTR_v10005989 [Xenopus tropicalis]